MTSSTHTSLFGSISGMYPGCKVVVDTSIKIIIHGMQFHADSWKQINRMQIINSAHLRHLPSMKTRKIMDMNSILIQSLTYEAFDQSVRHLINLQGIENL